MGIPEWQGLNLRVASPVSRSSDITTRTFSFSNFFLAGRDDDLEFAGSPRCRDTNTMSFESDNSCKAVNCGRPGPGPDAASRKGNSFPNIVFEVAYNEPERHVCN